MSEDLIIVQNLIYEIRGQRVMLDSDLAKLYQVTTGALNQAVKRNMERFPADFMFRLTDEEVLNMMSQSVISSKRKTSSPPFAFTEQGVAMLASVLKSPIAVAASISIMRAFVQVRQYLLTSASCHPNFGNFAPRWTSCPCSKRRTSRLSTTSRKMSEKKSTTYIWLSQNSPPDWRRRRTSPGGR